MRAWTLAALALGLLACTPSAPTADLGATRAEIEAVLGDQAKSWNAGDLEGFMAIYERGDRLLFTSGGKVRRGWQETHDKYATKYFAAEGAADRGSLRFAIEDLRLVGHDAAVVLGRWELTETPLEGGGLFTLVFVRAEGGWRIVHDHTSSDATK